MNEETLIVLGLVIFTWSVLANRFAALDLSGPLVLTVSGFLLANSSWGVVNVEINNSTVHHLAELTLALLLFADASAVPVSAARQDLPLTARLLGIGLPLAIVAGTGLALLLFPSLPLALAGLVGASLAPTDAALSAPVIADERLPIEVRQVLNIESGLNDGIATPVVTACIASAATALGLVQHDFDGGFSAMAELAIGLGVGVGVGIIGGAMIAIAGRHGWTQHGSRRLATLALALLSFWIASEVGGNPFVAAFIGGLAYGASARAAATEAAEFTELTGSFLSLVLWFIFGAGFVLRAFEQIDIRTALYAVASLTVVRMVPVAIAMIRSGQDRATIAFVGWFGPRGLASVVFGLLAVEELGTTDPRVIVAVNAITITIAFSIILHGITARPLVPRYVKSLPQARGTRN